MRPLQQKQVSATPLPTPLPQGERETEKAKASFRTPHCKTPFYSDINVALQFFRVLKLLLNFIILLLYDTSQFILISKN